MKVYWIYCCFILSVFFTEVFPAYGENSPNTIPGNQTSIEVRPVVVHVGMYLNQIRNIDLRNNRFVADFWVWFRYKDSPGITGMDYEVVGAETKKEGEPIRLRIRNENYIGQRVIADFYQPYDFYSFPLEEHLLRISLEDTRNEKHLLYYVADLATISIRDDMTISGWTVGKYSTLVDTHQYNTNFGDLSLPTNNLSEYSRFTFQVTVSRPGYMFFLKLTLGFIVATAVAILALLVSPDQLGVRIGLNLGALLGALASAYIVTAVIPDCNQVTLADRIMILSLGAIAVSMLESALANSLISAAMKNRARLFDRIFALTIGGAFVIGVVYLIAEAFQHNIATFGS